MKTKKIIISYFYMVLAKQKKTEMVPNAMSKLNPNASFISDSKSFM